MIYKRTEESERILKRIYTCIDENGGIAKKEQLVAIGVDYRRILDFVESGEMIRIKSGYYTYDIERFSETSLVSKLFPDGVLCMESALYVYGYISTKPLEFQMAIDKHTSKSRFKQDYPKVVPHYTEPEVLKIGVKTIEFENCPFQIYDKERLICDCLKYESKMDRKDFKDALQSYIQDEEKDVSTLMDYAKERKVLKKVQNLIMVWLEEEPVVKSENIVKNQSLTTDEKKKSVLSSAKEAVLAEDIFEIMKNQESISDMSYYDRVNEQLKNTFINGLYMVNHLKALVENDKKALTMKRLEQLSDDKEYENKKNKWNQYVKMHGEGYDEWEVVIKRFLVFLTPIWTALCADEVFFDDWMPELERFLS